MVMARSRSVLALQRAALLLLATPGTGADQARDLRQRFDIFYSRIQTLQQGRTYDHLRAEPGISTALMAISQAGRRRAGDRRR